MNRASLIGGCVFLTLAAATALAVHDIPWTPQAGFDVIGVLWLLSNLPKLMGWGFTFCFLGLALVCFARAVGVGGFRRQRFGSRGEEERLKADPRFSGGVPRGGAGASPRHPPAP